jgi:hypothetical protein
MLQGEEEKASHWLRFEQFIYRRGHTTGGSKRTPIRRVVLHMDLAEAQMSNPQSTCVDSAIVFVTTFLAAFSAACTETGTRTLAGDGEDGAVDAACVLPDAARSVTDALPMISIDDAGIAPDSTAGAPVEPGGTLAFVSRDAYSIFLGTATSKTIDAFTATQPFEPYVWVYYIDEVVFSIEEAITDVPAGGDHVVLTPVHCEAYDGCRKVDGVVISTCTGRSESNNIAFGERAIVFAAGGMPMGLRFKITVKSNGTVDLRQVGETDSEAPLSEVIARIQAYRRQ